MWLICIDVSSWTVAAHSDTAKREENVSTNF